MGGLAEKQIGNAITALEKRDEELAGNVIAADNSVDNLQHRIEELTIHLIGKRQPMASDLRDIVGALRISIDLERIGDFAKNISKRTGALTDVSYPNHLLKRLQQMADLALVQLKDVLDSYVQHDAAKAVAVWKHDENIDTMYTSLFRELLTYMMEDSATSRSPLTCCFFKISSGLAITLPISPKPSISWCKVSTSRRHDRRAIRLASQWWSPLA